MKVGKAVIIIIICMIALLLAGCIGSYNSIVSAEEAVTSSYADIETQLQRRSDLIPNLVNTVKGYMDHEQAVIDSVTASREKLAGADDIKEKADASAELTAAIGDLLVIVENYPDLKANENFIQLQDELAGTENRISTARRDYNDAVRSYNQKIKRIPGVFIASMFGFEKADYFEASEESQEVPDVRF